MQSLEWITDYGRFAEIAPDWDRLAKEEWSPFLTFGWIDAWYRAFTRDTDRLVAALWRDGALVGGLPLVATRRRWVAAANEYSLSFGLLAIDGQARSQLVEEVLARSIALTLPGLAEDEPALAAFLEAAHRERRRTWTETAVEVLVDTTASVEQYRAGISAKTRSELGRLRRKAEREHTLELRPLGEVTDLEGQFARALAVEASGWKGRAGTAIVCSRETEQFYGDIARAFHAARALRISEMLVDGDPAAMALSIIHRRRAFTIKFAYDERHRRLGPGFLLLTSMIERCFGWDSTPTSSLGSRRNTSAASQLPVASTAGSTFTDATRSA
jgi:CelD/BcsL family acetyltransferase involved in cellulose biosynthesis